MALDRHTLPPTTVLMAFEAASRLQSFTAAANELHLTQSAISRQIRLLEEMVGSPLFSREKQTVRLTESGRQYAREISEALHGISAATQRIATHSPIETLTLGVLPTFGARWLTPRLSAFLVENPGISLNIKTRLAPFDFQSDSIDAAIHFGAPQWRGANLDFLMHETVVPACSYSLRERYRIEGPEDLLSMPLVHLDSRLNAWERWFATHNVVADNLLGMQTDQFSIAAQAAISGIGVALLPKFLIENELSRGDLVIAYPSETQDTDAYYLAWPSANKSNRALAQFRKWLLALTKTA
jgi:LysR family glycine cleavage system transcriptional activator